MGNLSLKSSFFFGLLIFVFLLVQATLINNGINWDITFFGFYGGIGAGVIHSIFIKLIQKEKHQRI